jgi:type II secretory pathway pseudopilin PulG
MRFRSTKTCLLIIRRAYFTLVELLVVLAILLLIGSFIAINIKKALLDQRFRTEVNLIVDQIKLAQDLMLVMHKDVHLIFASDGKNGVDYQIKCDTPLPKGWDKEIERHHERLKVVRRVDFDDKLKLEPPKAGKVDIKFMSQGTVQSKGILVLSSYFESSEKGPLTRYICLPGYPSPIIAVLDYPNEQQCGLERSSFDEELTTHTIREVELNTIQKQKQNEDSLLTK